MTPRRLALSISFALFLSWLFLAYSLRPQPEVVHAGPSFTTLPTSPPLVPELGDVAALGRAQTTTTRPVQSSWHGHPCGPAVGLPPCWVMRRESGGVLHAYNASGCSGHGCYGIWQLDPQTGDGRGTEAQQDAEARRIWNGGKGCANWAAC